MSAFSAFLFSVLASACGQAADAQVAERPKTDSLLTVAERSDFRATSRSCDVLELMDQLARRAPHVSRLDFGKTVDGRPLAAAVAARPQVSSPDQLRDDERLVVLLLGNIHSGECAGKEALLMLLRETALDPDHRWLEHLVLLVVPNYNADGNDRMGKRHRPGQAGPEEGMGLRENAQGLDLNRDFVKLECPETRSLISLINRWRPHVLIDTHTTNGSRHRYALTYDAPHNPAAAQGPRDFLRKQMLPEITRRLEAKGLDTFFYGNFNPERTRWSAYGDEPRYGVEYMGLRGRMAILSEAYAYISYRERIEATQAFVGQCLDYLASERPRVTRVLRQAEKDVVEAGRQPRVGDRTAIRAKIAALPDKVVVKAFEPPSPSQEGQAAKPSPAAAKPKDYTVECFSRFEPTLEVPRPFAYSVPFDQSRAVDRLRMHGIEIEQLMEDASVEVEAYRVDKIRRGAAFQQHRLVSVEVASRREERVIPQGSFVVRTGQPLGNLAIYLLEPASDDGLVAWNFFDHTLREGEDHVVLRIPAAAKLSTRPVGVVAPAQQLDLEQIYGPEHKTPFGAGSAASLRWLPESTCYTRRIGQRTVRVDALTGSVETLHDSQQAVKAFAALPSLTASDARKAADQSGQLSPDMSATLISFGHDLFYYRFGADRALRLTHSPEVEKLAAFSPDGKLVAFVRNHNLHVVDVETGRERALTTEGTDTLLHGELDWVYQEELYGRGNFRGFWWSPESRYIAFLRLDETPVLSYTVPDDIPYRQSLELTRYPKAGDPIPRAALGVVPAAGGAVRWIDHYEYSAADFLIVRVGWSADGSRVVYQVQNRPQTWLDLRTADPAAGAGKRLLRETTPAWVEVLDEPRWLKDGSFLWLSSRSGQQHIYRATKDGQRLKAITRGDWSVRSILGNDAEEHWVYFLAEKDSPIETHCYRAQLGGGGVERITELGSSHSVQFNDSFTHFIDYSSDVHTPPRIRLHVADGAFVRSIDPNLDDYLPYYKIKRPEFLKVSNRDGEKLEAMLIKPPDFDPGRKYPILCYVYGGPQAPVVRNQWSGSTYLWHQMLAQKGYCTWLCDNRSAAAKGPESAWPIHRRLGQRELQDIEDGLSWLKSQPWADPQRVGIWGWSYGGYMASYALTHSKSFKIGIAGAPVTDWRNYDAIYTERYMGLPQDNPAGYRNSSVVEAAKHLHGRLLLVHGTTDDNVHLANTLQLVYSLQKAGKQLDLMVYPKNRHGIRQPQQLRHLRDLMTQFVLERL